jgi:glycosyltransferase involved in cell wall biosynthesis
MSAVNGILLISPERWDQHFVSKHHYAMALARRGARVLFLNPPDEALSSIVLSEVKECPGITVVDGPRVARGLRFYPGRLRRRLERRWLEQLEETTGLEIATVWLFENSRFFDLDFAGDRLKIYHQVDLNQEFNHDQAAFSADICFATTDFIRARLVNFSDRVHKVHHGLAEVKTPRALSNDELRRFEPDRLHAACIGNLDIAYLDVDLIERLVCRFPGVSFHLIGAYRASSPLRQRLRNADNVIWWGTVDHGKIPTLLGQVDINLVIYKAEDYREQLASPHKFMEYFASGKVVVATYTDEYKDKRDLLVMAEPGADFCALFQSVLEDLERYNSPDATARRQEFAHQHTYGKQLAKIEKYCQRAGLASPLAFKVANESSNETCEGSSEQHEAQ